MTDTQPARAVGAYGVEGLHTPNLDALAARGVRFDRAYTSCPVCTPARAGIFTGVMPSSTGAWANDMPLGSNVPTLGQRLQRHGYRTAYVGKWHLDGHDYFGAGECPPGWEPEYWYDGLRYLSDLSAEQRALWRGGLHSAEAIRQAGIGAEFTWAHRSVDRALAFMATAGDAAYLLAVSFDGGVEDWRADGRVRWQFQPLSRCVGPQSGSLCHVSSPRLVKPGAPISGTGLSCLLHVKGYAAYRVGSAFGVAHGLRTR